jgi:hypothetical protein
VSVEHGAARARARVGAGQVVTACAVPSSLAMLSPLKFIR